jgi:Trypsin-co-occurring domain 1
MGELLEFKTEAGDSVLVEVDQTGGPVTRGGRVEGVVVEAGESLEQVLGRLGPAVRGIVAQLRAAADWPDEVQVEFGVKLSADSNVIIARAGGEANFRIALRWARAPDASPPA